MKKSIVILCLMFSLTACEKQPEAYLIEANITGIKDSTKITLFDGNTYKVLDSTIIVNNKFFFKGALDHPSSVSVFTSDVNIRFWLENKKIKINASKKQLLEANGEVSRYVTGSETNKIALRYEKLLSPLRNRSRKAYKKLDKKIISKEEFSKYRDSITKISLQFYLDNPNNYLSISGVLDNRYTLAKDNLKEYFNLLSTDIKSSSPGKILDDYIHIEPLKEGDYITDIIGKNLKEEVVKLSDFKGKIIFLDFWAGWCPPCIKQIKEEFPSIIEKYKNKNFQIVSFSFDIDKNMWKSANDKLKIYWPDFSNLIRINNNPVALSYGITQIPTSFIISEEGKILKRVEYSDDLEKELDKFLLDK